MARTIRGINVFKYAQNYGYETYKPPKFEGILSGLYTATSTMKDYGDAQVTIQCEMNDRNRELAVVGNFVEVFYMKGQSTRFNGDLVGQNLNTDSLFSIFNVKMDAISNLITIIAEPMANGLRSGITIFNRPQSTSGSLQQRFVLTPIAGRENSVYSMNTITYSWRMLGTGGSGFRLNPTEHYSGLEMLGGKEGSLLDTWNGRFLKITEGTKNEPRVYQMPYMGNPDKKVILSNRTTVKGLSVEVDISEVYNGVCHFVYYEFPEFGTKNKRAVYYNQQSNGIEIYPVGLLRFDKLSDGSKNPNYRDYPTGRIYMKDWSTGMKDEISSGGGGVLEDGTPQDIARAKAWIAKEAVKWTNYNYDKNDPKLVINIDFNDLKQHIAESNETPADKARLEELYDLQLGDSVYYTHPTLKWTIQANVSGFTYNILSDEYTKLTIGQGTNNIYKRLNS